MYTAYKGDVIPSPFAVISSSDSKKRMCLFTAGWDNLNSFPAGRTAAQIHDNLHHDCGSKHSTTHLSSIGVGRGGARGGGGGGQAPQ